MAAPGPVIASASEPVYRSRRTLRTVSGGNIDNNGTICEKIRIGNGKFQRREEKKCGLGMA